MATQHVKVYEDKRSGGVPVWAWLLPLLLILALLAWYLSHRAHSGQSEAPSAIPATAGVAGMPPLGAVHFATDSAELTQGDQSTLVQASAYMKSHPGAHLRLEGYTDSTGNDPHNLPLSQRRSQTVATFMKAQGVDGARLTGTGFGPQNPVDTNTTANGKADNRRVELFAQP